jgi:acetyl-CoA synthetase
MRLHVSNRASSIATPQEIIFCDGIPKNKSGKIMRRVLKARYLGEDPGDTSTLDI